MRAENEVNLLFFEHYLIRGFGTFILNEASNTKQITITIKNIPFPANVCCIFNPYYEIIAL